MDALTPKDHAEAVAVFRSEVVGSLCRRDLGHGDLRAEFVALARQRFRVPGGDVTRTISIPTLERWYYASGAAVCRRCSHTRAPTVAVVGG